MAAKCSQTERGQRDSRRDGKFNMKVKIQLKDPDGIWESIREAAESSTGDTEGLDDNELEAIAEARRRKLEEQCSPWIDCGEYVTIEIDTDAGTAKVCEL